MGLIFVIAGTWVLLALLAAAFLAGAARVPTITPKRRVRPKSEDEKRWAA